MLSRLLRSLIIAMIAGFAGCASGPDEEPSPDELLSKISLPDGFKVAIYASGVEEARSLDLSPDGTLFVGSRRAGNLYAIVDENQDYVADTVYTLAEGLNMPNGVAYRDGSLYVAEVNRILRYDDIEKHLGNPPEPVVIRDDLPTEKHHGWKYINFGPDGKLYVPVGAPCNICESEDERFASILRMNADGSDVEVFAHGVRNTVGFDWHPDTGEMWFTDNGRDLLGDDIPADELNFVPAAGLHFGYPYIHQGDYPDPEFGKDKNPDDYRAPAQNLGPHVAALGAEFYLGEMFPQAYRKQLFVAEHGSWNRSRKIGYRVMLATIEENEVVSYEPFATGWLETKPDGEDGSQGEEIVHGRPVDVEFLPDGSMLLSDDKADVIYRITY